MPRRFVVLARRLVPDRKPDEAGKAAEVEQDFQPGRHNRIPIGGWLNLLLRVSTNNAQARVVPCNMRVSVMQVARFRTGGMRGAFRNYPGRFALIMQRLEERGATK